MKITPATLQVSYSCPITEQYDKLAICEPVQDKLCSWVEEDENWFPCAAGTSGACCIPYLPPSSTLYKNLLQSEIFGYKYMYE